MVAESEILRVRRSGATELTLSSEHRSSHSALSEIPESLASLNHLLSLDISNHNILAIPDCVRQLKKLRSLTLGFNRLTALPEWISELEELEVLVLDGNWLMELPSELFDLLRLQYLSLDRNQLSTISSQIGRLGSLRSLSACKNRLLSLPDSIGALGFLEYLDVRENQLTGIPQSLGRLEGLQVFHSSQNKLIEIPESICQLTQLATLDLSQNRLERLPESLGSMVGIRSLDVSRNQLISVPESIGELLNLQALNLKANKLATIPQSVGQLSKLRSLDVEANSLSGVPASIKGLCALESLDLGANNLASVPECLVELSQLQCLYLGGNRLRSLPKSLGRLSLLKTLHVEDNRLTTLPDSIGDLSSLRSLRISPNSLAALPDTIGRLIHLETLNVEDNNLDRLPNSIGQLTDLTSLRLSSNELEELPDSVGSLRRLTSLHLEGNKLKQLPETVGKLENLEVLHISPNRLLHLPHSIGDLVKLESLRVSDNRLVDVPESVARLPKLRALQLSNNELTDLPPALAEASSLIELDLNENPLNPELSAAYDEGIRAVFAYLRAKAKSQTTIHEAKLIVVGEGGVGKTCLLDALSGSPWREHDATHGIEVRTITAVDGRSGVEVTLNGWDFGGQQVYRPTHQLFFSAPAVYLVVWKPREGKQQGHVEDWIKLVRHREADAKIIVVATHGGPRQSQPDIDRQEFWDLYGKETIIDFFHVNSKPNQDDERIGISQLKERIVEVAMQLPEMGRHVPTSFAEVRATLLKSGKPYVKRSEVHEICRDHNMDDSSASLFVAISHRLGHLIHYEHDRALQDIVILKPDWLAIAISFVLDDEMTRNTNGLVPFSRLIDLWSERYPAELHHVFLRLMERFDLSYRVAGLATATEDDPVSLIAQLVPDFRPDLERGDAWPKKAQHGDTEQTQVCQIIDVLSGRSAEASGIFYMLIVRLHKFSLGRAKFEDSVHWQRGLVIDCEYNGRALIRYRGNDIHISVRAAYPNGLMTVLTEEVKHLVSSFWDGLRCDVSVKCQNASGCAGLFDIAQLIKDKKSGRTEHPCYVCKEWQQVDDLLQGTSQGRSRRAVEFLDGEAVRAELEKVRESLLTRTEMIIGRFDELETGQRRMLGEIDAMFHRMMLALSDEAKDGPRLFSFLPVDRSSFNPRGWVRQRFRLTLWCEHARLPLPIINEDGDTRGVYEIEIERVWFETVKPYLRLVTRALRLALPVASATYKLDEASHSELVRELNFSEEVLTATVEGAKEIDQLMGVPDDTHLAHGRAVTAQGASLRRLHALIVEKDPAFGGLERVLADHRRFVWVHHSFVEEV